MIDELQQELFARKNAGTRFMTDEAVKDYAPLARPKGNYSPISMTPETYRVLQEMPLPSADYKDLIPERMYMNGYSVKPTLLVFETNEYVHPIAWAQTEPDRGVILLRPPESRDYRLHIRDHEILHNVFPHAEEGFIHAIEDNPSYKPALGRFYLERR